MPRFVDAAQRRSTIIDASIELLSEGGLPLLTFGNLAKRLGGSMTLITHYFPTRAALIAALLQDQVAEADEFVAGLDSLDQPRARLESVMKWFLPLDDESLDLERARIALLGLKDVEPAVKDFLIQIEPAMRRAIERSLDGYVAGHELAAMTNILRVWTSGLTLSVIEHPESWPATRQLAVLDEFLGHLDLPTVLRAPAS